MMELSRRDRFLRNLRYEPVDRCPVYLAGPWGDTLERWRAEGLPDDVTDVHEYLDVKQFGYPLTNVSPVAGPHPRFEERVLREEEDVVYYIDDYGRTVRSFRTHTSMPEWIEFPVRDAEGLRYLDLIVQATADGR